MDSNYSNYFTVTPSDATTFARCTQAIYVGGAGNVSVVPSGNTLATVTFTAVPAGTTLSVRAVKIKSTGTTATNIVALGTFG